MSTFLNKPAPARSDPGASLPRPRLTIVPKVALARPADPVRRLVVVTVLVAGLVGLLLLNTSLQRGAYAVTDLQRRRPT